MQISSSDLMKVKSTDYLYDGDMVSLLKQEDDYKAWYSENTSFNYDNKPFVNWYRLFIYPKATQNDYFNKYDIIDTFPHRDMNEMERLKKEIEENKNDQ
jgi:hypothetical protein